MNIKLIINFCTVITEQKQIEMNINYDTFLQPHKRFSSWLWPCFHSIHIKPIKLFISKKKKKKLTRWLGLYLNYLVCCRDLWKSISCGVTIWDSCILWHSVLTHIVIWRVTVWIPWRWFLRDLLWIVGKHTCRNNMCKNMLRFVCVLCNAPEMIKIYNNFGIWPDPMMKSVEIKG